MLDNWRAPQKLEAFVPLLTESAARAKAEAAPAEPTL